jgi:hypothetical protein
MDIENFKSQKALLNYVKNVRDEIGVCDSIKELHPEYFIFFLQLFKRHPEYPEKIAGLVDIKIQRNPIFKKNLEVVMIKENNIFEDISICKACITGKGKDNLKEALREAIVPQIMKYKNNNDVWYCDICNSSEKIQIDHVNPQFEEMIYNFCQGKLLPTKFDDNSAHQAIFRNCDREFKDEWINYHQKNAILRPLCQSCNNGRTKFKKPIVTSSNTIFI